MNHGFCFAQEEVNQLTYGQLPITLIIMNRVRSKSDLPEKICVVCQRPFTWRKKWQDCWDEVKYCSERCRRRRSQAKDET
jgi:hypothetical protein